LTDIGDNDKFGPNLINCEGDIKILKEAAVVALVDWANNSLGTELAEYIFKNSPKSLLHFVDTGDIQDRKNDIPELLQVLADNATTTTSKSILSINENECNSLAEVMNFEPLDNVEKGEDDVTATIIEENIQQYLKKFAKKIKVSNIDLHANKYTAWSNGKETAFVPTRKVKINNLVGAGDSWDAADIVGYLAGLDAKERLTFSNAYVSLYISNPNSEPATMNEVIDLLKKNIV
jgi:ribokinase